MAAPQAIGLISEIQDEPLHIQAHAVYTTVYFDPVSDARATLPFDYPLPDRAIVGSARVRITAQPAGRTEIGNVARVRPASGDSPAATSSLVIDFGGLRSVSALTTPSAATMLRPWMGTAFPTYGGLVTTTNTSATVDFTEVATERLLVGLTNAATPDALATQGRVTLHDAPADIELVVAGERVHFAPGPVKAEGARYDETIDVTDAVQRAVDAGTVPVPIELRSSVPAQLSIIPQPGAHLEAHPVQFPEGERRTVAATDEGVVELRLPLAAGSSTWRVRLVRFDLQGDVGDRRVLPATGPSTPEGAELVVDPDHPAVIRLPPATLARLHAVDSLRVLVRAEQGTELSGHLCVEATSPTGDAGPGEPVPDAELTPTTVEPGDVTAWVTLPLVRPAAVDPALGTWVVLQASRGRVVMPLAVPAGDPDDDAVVLRVGANGRHRALPTVSGIATGAVPLRVGGQPPATAPIDALTIAIPGTPASTEVSATPGAAERFEIELDDPVTAATPGARDGDDLVLQLTVIGPGSHTVGPVTVGYEVAVP